MSDEESEVDPDYEPCEGCGELLDVTQFAPFEAAICPHCETETRVKREFGAYRLERRYAIGGMSVIFVGWDTVLNREVAIKVLNEEYCNDETRILAFENEARLTAQVNHPNVVQVYAVGRAYGRFYLVMELLDGQSFERTMSKRGALPEEEVLDIALQVAKGLQAAKKAGMIHRDVKPGNILIDQEGNSKLLDFGLALITQDGRARAEEVWATPYYVPPEALTKGEEDFRSDIYAFGATLYHALAGRPPFESTSTANKVLHRAKQTIPRLGKIAPWIGTATGETIDRMMAYKPEHRWKSYADVISALKHAKQNPGTGKAAPIHGSARVKRRNRGRNKWAVLVIFLAAATSVALLKPWDGPTPDTTEEPEPEPAPVEKPALTFTPTGEGNEELDPFAPEWKTIRALVSKQDYSTAEEKLVALSTNQTLSPTSRAWALLEACVTAYLDGRPGQGRDHANAAFLILMENPDQDPQTRSFRDLTHKLRHAHLPRNEDLPTDPKTLVDAMGALALSLKFWEQGQWQSAVHGFSKIRTIQLPEEYAWFINYQTRSSDYLSDGEVCRLIAELPKPKNEKETDAQINRLGDAIKAIKTKGRIRYNVRARQAYLSRLRKGFQERPMGSFNLSWAQMSAKLVESGQALRFDEIFAMIDNAPDEAPRESLWAWNYLHTQSKLFLASLEQQNGWTAKTSEGQILVPAGVDDKGLKRSDGALVSWTDLDPASLISAQNSFREADDRDGVISAICFAYTVGLTDLAEKEAEALAANDPEFLKDWKRVLVGTSQ